MTLSIVIITLNEERNISRCLQSVIGIADEIVVVDSFSKDRTEKICKQFNVKFISNKFEDYASQKNFAILQSTGDYILSLDADEQLNEVLRQEILKIKHNNIADAYSFNRMTNYCGEKWIKHCGWYPDTTIRLVKRELAHFEGAFVHEGIRLNASIKLVHLKGDLLHYSYYTTEEHINRINKYSTLGAKKYIACGKQVNLLDIVFKPCWTFFRTYFLQLGFLDGWVGYRICKIVAFETFIKCIKVRQLSKKKS
ncbi:MAG: glycosyltransferase family 2 protein [Bacteroidales bacterium]